MLLMQYTHRLPSDYDMNRIRQRAAQRGPDWDAFQGLIFKGFLIQEKAKNGALSNAYSSLYLWKDAEAASRMITAERFQAVIDAFGRPRVETFLVVAAAFGPSPTARFVRRSDGVLSSGVNLASLKHREEKDARNRSSVEDVFAAIAAIDVSGWRTARFEMSAANRLQSDASAADYEIAYLAQPGTA
jgi:hypothetical protein